MRKAGILLITAVVLIPASADARHRAGNAAIGAVAGGVVFGPVGALAGAAVGYTAGEGIARDWGFRHHSRSPHRARHTQNR
ncbi:MAG TPA: hypothetical protein VH684_22615 [Xanthobacteraceae bacterium]